MRQPMSFVCRRALGGVSGLALLVAIACGGSAAQKGAEEPAAEDEAAPEDEGAGDESMIPPEKFDEIRAFFTRKNPAIARCFVDAIEAGEIPKNSGGRLTVTATISAQGKPQNIRVTEMNPRSGTLERCVMDTASRWTVTTLPKATEYSHLYSFESL